MNRVSLINRLIEITNGTAYLEIGLDRGFTITRIKCEEKVGVDPTPRFEQLPADLAAKLEDITVFQMTSDEFFKQNTSTFDVILVDGRHLYEYALRDIVNAFNCLKPHGWVVVHDCNPTSAYATTRDEHEGIWNGDVWKAIYHIKTHYKGLDYFVLDVDFGLGIIRKPRGNSLIDVSAIDEQIASLEYAFLDKHRQEILNLKPSAYFESFIRKQTRRKRWWETLRLHELKQSVLRLCDFKQNSHLPSLGCIYLLDEFEWNAFIPWQISLQSALRVCDEIIIVKGKRSKMSQDSIAIDPYLRQLNHPNIKIVEYAWPEEFSWFEIVHALNLGLLHCRTTWVFRLLMDEIMPYDQFHTIKQVLQKYRRYDILTVGRYRVLGNNTLFPAYKQELFFKNKLTYAYGRISANEPKKKMPLLFDAPIKLNLSERFFELSMEEYLMQFQESPPLGCRVRSDKIKDLNVFILNTDVNYFPDDLMLKQKKLSAQGYLRLPQEYRAHYDCTVDGKKIRANYVNKIQEMLKGSDRWISYQLPDDLKAFIHQFDPNHSITMRLFHTSRGEEDTERRNGK